MHEWIQLHDGSELRNNDPIYADDRPLWSCLNCKRQTQSYTKPSGLMEMAFRDGEKFWSLTCEEIIIIATMSS